MSAEVVDLRHLCEQKKKCCKACRSAGRTPPLRAEPAAHAATLEHRPHLKLLWPFRRAQCQWAAARGLQWAEQLPWSLQCPKRAPKRNALVSARRANVTKLWPKTQQRNLRLTKGSSCAQQSWESRHCCLSLGPELGEEPQPPHGGLFSGYRAKGGLFHTRHSCVSAYTDLQSGTPASSWRKGSVRGHHTWTRWFSATLPGAREHRETASCCLACHDQSALLELLWPAEVELFVEHADCDSSWPWLCLVERVVRSNELASWAVS